MGQGDNIQEGSTREDKMFGRDHGDLPKPYQLEGWQEVGEEVQDKVRMAPKYGQEVKFHVEL